MVNPQSTGDNMTQGQVKAFSGEEKTKIPTNFDTGKN